MEVTFKKDSRNNYMIISPEESKSVEPYCVKLLSHQIIDGLLLLEQRMIDNKILFYYNITAKQSVSNMYEKASLNYEKVKNLFTNLITTIDKAYDYLLSEDDLLLTPEFIYIDVISDQPYLCYLSGYHINVKEQMNSFIEFIMNKVNYNDKEAVLLVYQLYAASKAEGFTLEHLKKVLDGNKEIPQQMKIDQPDLLNTAIVSPLNLKPKKTEEDQASTLSNIPVMMEKLTGEVEKIYFPIGTYLYSGMCILGGILVFVLGFASRILYNSFGSRIEVSKLMALSLIVLCVEGYLQKRLWDKKNQVTKMVEKSEYIDPRKDQEKENGTPGDHIKKDTVDISYPGKVAFDNSDDDYNPTCLLSEAATNQSTLILKPMDEIKYQSINIKEFPFFIGKLKKNVDYCLEKDVVSRYHAKITKEQDQLFLTDLNSTNGTFLNKEQLQTYQKKEIKQGDEICFANIGYVVLSDN